MSQVLGHCPICSLHLFRDGDNLICENGDFAIPEKIFDRLWDDFIADPSHKDNLKLVEKLIEDLVDENIIGKISKKQIQ